MVLIRTNAPINGIGEICFKHFAPETLKDDQKEGGVLLDSYTPPDIIPGKETKEYYNFSTKEVTVEYVDKPKTTAQIISEQATQIASINYSLMMGGLA